MPSPAALLTIVSIRVELKTPMDLTEFHVIVAEGDGPPFRLRSPYGRPLRLTAFPPGRTSEQIAALLPVGAKILVPLEVVGARWQTTADDFQVGDRAIDPKKIVHCSAHQRASPSSPPAPHTAAVPGTIEFNAGGSMGKRVVNG